MLIVACLCDMTMNFWCEKGEGAWVHGTPLALLWDWSCVGRDMLRGFVELKFFPGEKYLIVAILDLGCLCPALAQGP